MSRSLLGDDLVSQRSAGELLQPLDLYNNEITKPVLSPLGWVPFLV